MNNALLTNLLKTTFDSSFNILNRLSTRAFVSTVATALICLLREKLILELKSVDKLTGIHEAQLLTYMKLADVKTGLLINFNIAKLKDGIKRFVL